MPRYKPETAKLKANNLLKPYIRSGFNQTIVARQLGVSPSAIAHRLEKKPVRDALQKFLDSPKLTAALIEEGFRGLKADRPTDEEGGTAIDYNTRHKFWHDFLVARGKLKINSEGNGPSVVNIIYAYRKPKE